MITAIFFEAIVVAAGILNGFMVPPILFSSIAPSSSCDPIPDGRPQVGVRCAGDVRHRCPAETAPAAIHPGARCS